MSPQETPVTRRASRKVLLGAAALIAVGGAFGASNIVPFAIAQVPATAQPNTPAANVNIGAASFADVIERVRGAVVSVKVSSTEVVSAAGSSRESGRGIPNIPGMQNEQLERFFRQFRGEGAQGVPPRGGRSMSQGSGFIISADGYVVTNNHVIRNASELTLVLDDGKTVTASLVGSDEKTDLALLKIREPGTYKFVNFADKLPRVGDWVLAVGNPFGLGGTVTAGIISARGRDIGAGPYDDFLQIDASVNRGNSGGPTFDINGNVAGVNTAIYSPSGGSVGIGFAIPSTVAQAVIASLRDNGTVSRGYLGVQIQAITPDIAASMRLPDENGALVADAQTGTPAANAGLRAGDVIVAVNGDRITSPRELSRKIASLGPSQKAGITYRRDGAERTASVTLAAQPNERQASARESRRDGDRESGDRSRSLPGNERGSDQSYGMSLEPAGSVAGGGAEGVVVAEIRPDGVAARQGIRSGDIILEAAGQKVTSPEDVSRAIANARQAGHRAVMLRIKSGEGSRFVALTTRPS